MLTLETYIKKTLNNIITEGGAAGHMLHPWQLDKVKTLNDLVDWYDDVVVLFNNTEKKAFVKIDGQNISIRFKNGEFVVDRLTKDVRDIEGVRYEEVDARFADSFAGFSDNVKNVLKMFNEAIPSIKNELKVLGLLDNDQIMLNVEYVTGKTNKVQYNTDFITIHGLLEIETTPTGSRKTKIKPYSQSVLDKMADTLNTKFGKYGFECCTQFPAIMTDEPDYASVFKNPLEIKGVGKKSVKEWLSEYGNTPLKKTSSITLTDGSKKTATSIQLMNDIRNGADLSNLVIEKHLPIAITCFLMMYINSELGYAVLDVFNNKKLGKLSNQEGVVITDNSINGVGAPVKITGKFIYR